MLGLVRSSRAAIMPRGISRLARDARPVHLLPPLMPPFRAANQAGLVAALAPEPTETQMVPATC